MTYRVDILGDGQVLFSGEFLEPGDVIATLEPGVRLLEASAVPLVFEEFLVAGGEQLLVAGGDTFEVRST